MVLGLTMMIGAAGCSKRLIQDGRFFYAVSDFVLPLPDPVSTAEHPAAPIIIVNPKTIANNFFAIFLSPFDNLLNISVTGFHLFFGNSHFFTNHHYNYIKKYK